MSSIQYAELRKFLSSKVDGIKKRLQTEELTEESYFGLDGQMDAYGEVLTFLEKHIKDHEIKNGGIGTD